MTQLERTLEHAPRLTPAAPAAPDPVPQKKHGGTLLDLSRRVGMRVAGTHPWPGQEPSVRDRADVRYGLSLLFVIAAIVVTSITTNSTGRLVTFPFYAAVISMPLSSLAHGSGSVPAFWPSLYRRAAADFWTPGWFNLDIQPADLPSFLAFVLFALMSLAWGFQRRRAQYTLEATVQQRTTDLVEANAALQAEMAKREMAQKERDRTLHLATMAELAATIAHEINQPLAAITANGSACLRSLAHDAPILDTAREAAACIVADGHRAGDVIVRVRALSI